MKNFYAYLVFTTSCMVAMLAYAQTHTGGGGGGAGDPVGKLCLPVVTGGPAECQSAYCKYDAAKDLWITTNPYSYDVCQSTLDDDDRCSMLVAHTQLCAATTEYDAEFCYGEPVGGSPIYINECSSYTIGEDD